MSEERAGENMRFAEAAMRHGLVTREQLAAGLKLWAGEQSRGLAELMVREDLLSADNCNLIHRLVERSRAANGKQSRTAADSQTIGLPGSRVESYVRQLEELHASLVESEPDGASAPGRDGSTGKLAASPVGEETSAGPTGASHTRPDGEAHYRRQMDVAGSRFSVVRSHAKGGLGEVFVARDHQLAREVALKEIQPRFATDTAAQARFELEACITGGLEHPGVVPVYAFGHYPDGRPYYAMRFIRGESLKEEIAQFHELPTGRAGEGQRRLAFRRLLRRFVDACNAIAYAHSRGVLHRDIKPANIMLGKYGETLVVDWGLAKTVGRDGHHRVDGEDTLLPLSGSGGTETLQGSTIGTPAYMSPEQAQGRIEELGPASDIFSLGATFYMLLCGRPAFEGKSAKAIVERVKLNEFRPSREVRPDVPRPLNAICQRAMATRPEDRYATALDLASEVERFLADEPVAAYRESLHERFRRWLKRNRTLATAAAVLLLTAGVASAVGFFLVSAEKKRTVDALTRVSAEQEKTSAALEQVSLAEKQARSALSSTQTALNTVTDDFIGELMARQIQLTPLDKAFFSSVIGQYETLNENLGGRPETAAMRAVGLLRLGNLQRRLDNLAGAANAYRDAEAAFSELLEETPGEPALVRDLASARGNLGLTHAAEGKDDEALKLLDDAGRLLRQVMDGDFTQPTAAGGAPGSAVAGVNHRANARLELGRVLINRGNVLAGRRQADQAEAAYREALGLLDEKQFAATGIDSRRDLARVAISLGGVVSTIKDRAAEAVTLFESAIRTLDEVLVGGNEARPVREELGIAHLNFGAALGRIGRAPDAVIELRKAADIQAALVNEFPAINSNRQELARCRFGLARVLEALGDPAAAEEYAAAVTGMDQLVARFPERPQFRRDLARFLDAWGLWAKPREPIAARAAMNRALELRKGLQEANPDVRVLDEELFATEVNLANFERESENWETAVGLYRDLRARLEPREEIDPDWTRAVDFGLGDSLVHVRDHATALACWERLCMDPEDAEWDHFELQRAICLAWTGKAGEGVGAALALTESSELEPVLLYDVACCLSVAAGATGTSSEQRTAWLDQAMTYLGKAEAGGFFDDAMKVHAANDPDLATLRDHPPFREFAGRVGIK